MSLKKIFSVSLFLTVFSIQYSFGSAPQLDNIDLSDFEGIVKDFSANSMHSSVSPASSLGTIFGLELGLVGGIAKAPEIERLTREEDSSSSLDFLPHAAILGAASFPGFITAEFTLIPTLDLSDVEYKTFSFAGKWTFSEFLGAKSPFKFAGRFHFANATLSYTDSIQNSSTGGVPAQATVELDSKVWGAHILTSVKIPLVEPYIGLGFVRASGSLSVSGGFSIFDQNFSLASSADQSVSSGHFFGGINLNLLFLKIGAEVSKAFSTTSINGKVSFYF